MTLPAHRADYMTDYSYSKTLFVVAHYQIVAAGLSQQRSSVGYATILQLDAGLQREISRLELVTECSNPRLRRCELHPPVYVRSSRTELDPLTKIIVRYCSPFSTTGFCVFIVCPQSRAR
jgi:hypothetical protein